MGRRLWQLSRIAHADEKVRGVLSTHAPTEALEILRQLPQAKNFIRELDTFLSHHGHRGIKELELGSPRWDEEPAPVIGMIKNFLAVDETDHDRISAGSERRGELEEQLRVQLRTGWLEALTSVRYRLVKFLIREARYFIKLRENSRFYHIMGFGLARKKILVTEQRLLALEKLRCRDDIFYLQWSELVDLQSGQLGWRDVEDRIRLRRLQRIRLAKQGAPQTIGVERGRCEQPVVDGYRLHGQTASPGSYEGRARVILDPANDVNIQPGEILIAPYTDPAWTPLFLIANAAVVEVGSYLSHAGTVAREYGMPCIVDVRGCTSRINTGDLLRVDGATGDVWILSEVDNRLDGVK